MVSKAKKLLINITLLIISTSLCLVIIDFALPKLGYKRRDYGWIFSNEEFVVNGEFRTFFTLDKDEIFIPRKNSILVKDYWETDENGFRFNPNHTNHREEFEKIIIIGDSYAYGHGVSHEGAWSSLVEKNISKNKEEVIIYNAACPASSTDQQYVRLQKLVSKFDPKIVIWMISFNDMVETNLACLFKKTKTGGYKQVPGFFNIAYINAFFIKHLPKRFVLSNIGNLFFTQTPYGKDLYTFGCTKNIEDTSLIPFYFEKLEYLLHKAKLDLDSQGIQLLVVLAPSQLFFDNKYDNLAFEIKFLDYFRNAFDSAGVDYLDLNFEIAKIADSQLYANRIQENYLALKNNKPSILGMSTGFNKIKEGLNISLYLDESRDFAYGGWHLNSKGNQLMADIIIKKLFFH